MDKEVKIKELKKSLEKAKKDRLFGIAEAIELRIKQLEKKKELKSEVGKC